MVIGLGFVLINLVVDLALMVVLTHASAMTKRNHVSSSTADSQRRVEQCIMVKQRKTRRLLVQRPTQFWVGLILILAILFVAIFADWLSSARLYRAKSDQRHVAPLLDGGERSGLSSWHGSLGPRPASRLMVGAHVSTRSASFRCS